MESRPAIEQIGRSYLPRLDVRCGRRLLAASVSFSSHERFDLKQSNQLFSGIFIKLNGLALLALKLPFG